MRTGRGSRTAEYMAFFRALETARPTGTRLFEDRLAAHFLSPSRAIVAHAAALPLLNGLICRYIDVRWPGARTSAVARTRFIDESIHRCLDGCPKQFVILGAGFDTRAFRLPALDNLPVYVVDHPDTLRVAMPVLERVRADVHPRLRFVPIDFNHVQLDAAMRAAGFVRSTPAVFLWEGVTNYLTADAVDETLRWCAQSAEGSWLVFTYVDRAVLDEPHRFSGTERLMDTLAKAGERWTFGFDPAAVPGYLAERGLTLETDVGANQYRQWCYGASAQHMSGYEFYRVAVVRVPPR